MGRLKYVMRKKFSTLVKWSIAVVSSILTFQEKRRYLDQGNFMNELGNFLLKMRQGL